MKQQQKDTLPQWPLPNRCQARRSPLTRSTRPNQEVCACSSCSLKQDLQLYIFENSHCPKDSRLSRV